MTVKVEKKLKVEAHKTAEELGFPLGTLVNAFLRQFVRNKTIYFTVLKTEVMSREMEKQLNEIEKDIITGKNISPSFDNIKDTLARLKST